MVPQVGSQFNRVRQDRGAHFQHTGQPTLWATIKEMGVRNDLPIVCTLSPAALAARRGELLPDLFRQATAREALPTGYRLSFGIRSDILESITRTISTERQCCRFLRFQLTIEPDGGPILLDVTGPDGTREFLDSL